MSHYSPLTVRIAAFSMGSLALAITGCGGGSGGAAATGSGQTQLGLAVVKFLGFAKPMLATSSGTVSVVGMTSTSSITNVNLNPSPNMSATSLLFIRNLTSGAAAFTVPSTGGTESLLVKSSLSARTATCSNLQLVALALDHSIWTLHADGTGLKQLTNTGTDSAPTFSPGGATIAYVSVGNLIKTIPITGGTPTTIFTAPGGADILPSGMSWSPVGNKIAFAMFNSVPGHYNIYTIPASGGTATNVTPVPAQSDDLLTPVWTPDGQNLLATDSTSGAVVRFIPSSTTTFTQTPSGLNDLDPTVSPDGTKVAFYRNSTGGGTPGIYVTSLFGSDSTLVLPDSASAGITGAVISLDWMPFLQQENFVGTSIAQLSASPVTGFLLAQNGSQFGSMFSFTATTPSTATIATPVTTGTQPLIFTISADSITSIAWTNVYSGAKSSSTLTGTPSMVVSVDAMTGKIDLVAPALAPAKATMSPRKTVVYSGKFSAVYDNAGKNLAPRGASRIELDPTSGKAVSVG